MGLNPFNGTTYLAELLVQIEHPRMSMTIKSRHCTKAALIIVIKDARIVWFNCLYIHCVLVPGQVEDTWKSESAQARKRRHGMGRDDTWVMRVSRQVWCICAKRQNEETEKETTRTKGR